MSESPPPPDVLRAFGLAGDPTPLTGGQAGAWRVGGTVLKQGVDPLHQEWTGTALGPLDQVGFRLADVRRAGDGRWVVDGWGASGFLPGTSSETGSVDWATVLDAGRAFHAATRALPRPAWLAERSDWWAHGDRAAWGDRTEEVMAPLRPLVEALEPLLEPLGPDQIVHADLTGNVLLEPGSPPGIIDVSPLWRPAAYAEGIVVADALCWHGARADLARRTGVSRAAVARGLLFRVLTTEAMQRDRPDPAALARDIDHYTAALPELDRI
ncbi:TIGR02569 family protein [Brachybacterium sp. NBEC-018]|uniref:TIGR02569 family protein n=1 Tax=Brachybacterium sp. NBEC-018 TaxID=2996004 RepID=UPI0021753203|nr:TIGR02569 family protein [Brachybacterium sp. NBEC-018]UVY83965.1 TIGR02569 family protein [Brachybacterium sp. NBEC-018]